MQRVFPWLYCVETIQATLYFITFLALHIRYGLGKGKVITYRMVIKEASSFSSKEKKLEENGEILERLLVVTKATLEVIHP